MKALPKRATIVICRLLKDLYLGTRGRGLHLFGRVLDADDQTVEFSNRKSTVSTSVTVTTGTLRCTDISYLMKRLNSDLSLLNPSGLADTLGITKEGATRLIWLCVDARNTSNGSSKYSAETILRARNALYVERILKQTTSPYALLPSWMKKELPPTKQPWYPTAYGIRTMVAPYVVNATAI